MQYDYTGVGIEFRVEDEVITPDKLTKGWLVLEHGSYYENSIEIFDEIAKKPFENFKKGIPDSVGSAKTGKSIQTMVDLTQWSGTRLLVSYNYYTHRTEDRTVVQAFLDSLPGLDVPDEQWYYNRLANRVMTAKSELPVGSVGSAELVTQLNSLYRVMADTIITDEYLNQVADEALPTGTHQPLELTGLSYYTGKSPVEAINALLAYIGEQGPTEGKHLQLEPWITTTTNLSGAIGNTSKLYVVQGDRVDVTIPTLVNQTVTTLTHSCCTGDFIVYLANSTYFIYIGLGTSGNEVALLGEEVYSKYKGKQVEVAPKLLTTEKNLVDALIEVNALYRTYTGDIGTAMVFKGYLIANTDLTNERRGTNSKLWITSKPLNITIDGVTTLVSTNSLIVYVVATKEFIIEDWASTTAAQLVTLGELEDQLEGKVPGNSETLLDANRSVIGTVKQLATKANGVALAKDTPLQYRGVVTTNDLTDVDSGLYVISDERVVTLKDSTGLIDNTVALTKGDLVVIHDNNQTTLIPHGTDTKLLTSKVNSVVSTPEDSMDINGIVGMDNTNAEAIIDELVINSAKMSTPKLQNPRESFYEQVYTTRCIDAMLYAKSGLGLTSGAYTTNSTKSLEIVFENSVVTLPKLDKITNTVILGDVVVFSALGTYSYIVGRVNNDQFIITDLIGYTLDIGVDTVALPPVRFEYLNVDTNEQCVGLSLTVCQTTMSGSTYSTKILTEDGESSDLTYLGDHRVVSGVEGCTLAIGIVNDDTVTVKLVTYQGYYSPEGEMVFEGNVVNEAVVDVPDLKRPIVVVDGMLMFGGLLDMVTVKVANGVLLTPVTLSLRTLGLNVITNLQPLTNASFRVSGEFTDDIEYHRDYILHSYELGGGWLELTSDLRNTSYTKSSTGGLYGGLTLLNNPQLGLVLEPVKAY